MTTTVITHVYNEEYLIGWWAKHHAPLFDRVIVIDYASTDRTLEIIRNVAPDWEIRQSRNAWFSAADVDREVMDIESEVSGWKVALTATEFLCGDVAAVTESLAIQGCSAAQIRCVAMVDMAERTEPPDPDVPLVDQCHTGYFGGRSTTFKSRVIHNHPHGAYSVGRHGSQLSDVWPNPDGLLLKWFGFAPWCEPMRQRKMAIQHRIPPDDKAQGLGYQHQVDAAQLNLMWQSEVALSADLSNDPNYTL